MKEELKTIIQYRLEQATDSLKEAEILFNSGGSFRSVINRSYYAMFYSVLALVARKGMGTSKHYGVLSIFDKEYVRNRIFPTWMSKLLHQAFALRQNCDYKEFSVISKEEVLEIMNGSKDFLDEIKGYLD